MCAGPQTKLARRGAAELAMPMARRSDRRREGNWVGGRPALHTQMAGFGPLDLGPALGEDGRRLIAPVRVDVGAQGGYGWSSATQGFS